MEIYDGFETVRQKLIIAGMQEIENHGITDFSLRRVASLCNVSCAAPYKHFKDKDDFIAEIVAYINNQWILLRDQVMAIFSDDPAKQLVETCVAYVRFWIANPNFRSVMSMRTHSDDGKRFDVMSEISRSTNEVITSCCTRLGFDEARQKKLGYIIRSMLCGTTQMIDNGELENGNEAIVMLRKCIDEFITQA